MYRARRPEGAPRGFDSRIRPGRVDAETGERPETALERLEFEIDTSRSVRLEQPAHRRLRGPGALATPRARSGAAERVHPPCRGDGLSSPSGAGCWSARALRRPVTGSPRSRSRSPLTLSVNLSARQLAEADLVEPWRRSRAHRFPPALRLHLEITESVSCSSGRLSR